MRRWAIPFAGSALFFVLFFLLQTSGVNAQVQTFCDAAGVGTVNWTPAFEGCSAGDTYRIPTGITVVLDNDQTLANSLVVLGTLDATSGEHALTLTGNKALTLTGTGLTFYDLTVNLGDRALTVDAPNLEVSHRLTLQQGRFKIGPGKVNDVNVQVDGTLAITDTLEVKGNFANAGGLLVPSARVIFNGGDVQELTVTSATTFDEVEVTAGTTLEEAHSANLANATHVINHGIIRTHRIASVMETIRFGIAGAYRESSVELGFYAATGLTEVVLERNAVAHPAPPLGKTTQDYWKFIPVTAITDVDAVVRLPYNWNEFQHPMLCKYSNADWDCATSSVNQAQVTRMNVTQVEGDWAVFDGNPTTLSLAAAPNPVASNASVTFTATITPVAEGDVQFYMNNVVIGSPQPLVAGSAHYVASGLANNNYYIKAKYLGQGLNLASEKMLQDPVRVRYPATVSLVTPSAIPVYGEPVTLEATVAPVPPAFGTLNGMITFQADGVPITGCADLYIDNGGYAQCTTGAFVPGAQSITAVFSGGGDFAPAVSAPTSLEVAKAPTTVIVSSSHNPAVHGESVTVTATVSAGSGSSATPTGDVTFTDLTGANIGCSTTALVAGQAACTFAATNMDGYAVEAAFVETDYFIAGSSTLDQAVVKANSSVVLSALPSSTRYGESVTFTAAVAAAAPGTGVPTQTVTFKDGSAAIAGCNAVTLDAGAVATCTTGDLGAGAHTISAEYSGNDEFNPSSDSIAGGYSVGKADTDVTVTATPGASVYGESVAFEATVAAVSPGAGIPTALVAFKDGATPIVGCDAVVLDAAGKATCNTTALDAGNHDIFADYGGDANFNSASGRIKGSFTVAKALTEATVTSSHNPSVYGETVTLTASITSTAPSQAMPVGSVEFQDLNAGVIGACAAVTLTNGEATCTFVTDNLTGHSIRARFLGSDNFVTSDGTLSQSVGKADTAVTVTASVNPSVYGQRVTFTATVAVEPPGAGNLTGKIAFQDQGITINGCAQVALTNGKAECATNLLAVGNHVITAEYVDDEHFAGSTGTLSGGQVVDQNGATTVLAATPNPAAYGETVFITATVQLVPPPDTFGVQAGGPATVANPTGVVAFIFDSIAPPTPVTVDANGVATLQIDNFTVGSHTIDATYNGDKNYLGSNAESITQKVDTAATAVSVVADPSPSVLGQAVTFTATVAVVAPGAGAPTGDVGFTIDGGPEQLVTLGTDGTAAIATALLAVGTHSVDVRYAGDTNFQPGTASLDHGHTVEKPDVDVTVSANPSSTVYGESVTFDATVAALPPGTGTPTSTVMFKDGNTAIANCSAIPLDNAGNASCTTSSLSIGDHTITVEYGGNDEFNSGSGAIKSGFTVDKAATTVSAETAPNRSSYGQPVLITATVAVTGAGSGAPGGAISFQATGGDIEGCQNLVLTAGGAVCTTTTLPVGGNTLRITYGGDANFHGSYVDLATQHQVDQATPVVTLTGSPNPSAFLGNVEYIATVSAPAYQGAAGGLGASAASVDPPSGTVTFDLDGTIRTETIENGVATVSTTSLNVGSRSIRATYNGDPNYVVAPSEVYTQTVARADTATTLAVSPNPAYWDDDVVFTATVSYQAAGISVFKNTAPTGTVTFTDATGTLNLSTTLDQGVAVVNAGQLPPGAYEVVATYVGNDQFSGSAAAPTTLHVQKHASTTTLTSSDNPIFVSAGLNFHVEVNKLSVAGAGIQSIAYPTGAITLTDATGALNVGGVLFEGAVDLYGGDLSEGTYNVVATYSGDTRHEPSTSAVLVQVVKRHRTSAVVTVTPNMVLVGEVVAFTVNISDLEVSAQRSGPAGEVQYWVDGKALGSAQANNGEATLIRTAQVVGNYVITATYAGSTVYGPSTSDEAQLIVKQRLAAATLSASPNPSRLGESVVLTATVVEREVKITGPGPVVPTPTGDVVFLDGDTELGSGTLAGGIATLAVATLDAGTHELRVRYAGDSAFKPATSPAYSHVVQPLPLAVNDAAGTLEGQPVTVAVLANDHDPVGGGLAIFTITQPLNGVVEINPTGEVSRQQGSAIVTYTPNPGFAGIATFSYVAQDANGNTDDGQVAIVVAARQQNGQPSKVAPVDPTQESHAVFTDTHTSVNLIAPVGIYTGTLTDKDVFYLAYTPILTPIGDVNQQPGGMKFGNYVFHLDAFLNGGQLPNFQFAQPITLTISYDPLLLGDLHEELLVLYYWNGTTWSSDGITLVSRDTTNHTISVRVAHLSEFSFFSAPELQRIMLPYISGHRPLHSTAPAAEAVPAESAPAPGD